MKQLLLKEYYTNQMTYIYTIVFFLITAWVITNTHQVPSFLSVLFAGTFLFSSSYVDERNNSHILMNSLPVNRRLVVSSKYLSALLVGMLLIILTVGINFLIPAFTPLTGMDIALSVAATIITIALFYPAYIIFGPRFMSYVFLAFFIGVLGIGPLIFNTNLLETMIDFLQQQSTVALISGISAVSIVTLSLSWMISVRVYGAKQF